MAEKRTSKAITANLSTEKALSILEILANEGEPMRLMDITQTLESSSSTVLRFLTTLQSCGYVRQDPETMKYCLTFKICNLSNKIISRIKINEVASSYLKALSKVVGESVTLAIEQDMSVVYIDVEEGPDQMIRTMQRIGNVAPMHCTGIGKLFLVDYTPEKIELLIKEKGLTKYTDKTISERSKLTRALKIIKSDGYAYDDEECEIGARCIAYPIYDFSGRVIAGISVTGPVSRMSFEKIDSHKELMANTARAISVRMGYRQV